MQKVVLAIDSFKGSLRSAEAIQAAKEGVRSVFPDCKVICLPVSDGGEGILDVLVAATGGRYISLKAHDPLMKLISTRYGLSKDGKTALIEMAEINGLPLVPTQERNPMVTTSYGSGELIKDALNRGCQKFIIGIGGSATNDAGLGMLQALGFQFRDKKGKTLNKGGQIMAQVASIDNSQIHPALSQAQFNILTDVRNPFNGPEGAAFVFARQKGADDDMIRKLDAGMQSLARLIAQTTGKDIFSLPGTGAAGGIGGGFLAFLNAKLNPGIPFILDLLHFRDQIRNADLIITGEGHADRQTLMGKVPSGILDEARKQNIPVILIAGNITDLPILNQAGFQGIFSTTPFPISLEKAMETDFALTNIKNLVTQLCQLIKSQP